MRKILISSAFGIVLSWPAAAAPIGSAPDTTNPENAQQKIASDLQASGFSEIKVMPESFLVRAKDKSGNPVLMVINPDSVSELVMNRSVSTKAAPSAFVKSPSSADRLTTNLIGMEAYDESNQGIGRIRDLAVDQSGSVAYIIGLNGGGSGGRQRYVAIAPSAVSWSYDDQDKKWRVIISDATENQIKDAPQFNYDAAKKNANKPAGG